MTGAGNPLFAGVDLGGTNFTTGLGDSAGRIHVEERHPTCANEGPHAVLGRIAASVEALASQVGEMPTAVGLGIPGLVDLASGVSRFLPNMPTQWRDIPVSSILSVRLGVPVYVLNDARAAALGESMFGHGRDARTMVLFTLGTGVGGGIAIDGRLHLGPLGSAGEIGHICVQPDGPRCSCGSRGCLEVFASGPALVAEGVRLMKSGNAETLFQICGGDASRITPVTLGEAAVAGDSAIREAISRAGGLIGLAASSVVLALHPDLIVLGGGVSALDALLIPPMREVIEQRVRMFPVNGLRILRSMLGDRAGVYGGLAAAIQGGVRPALYAT